MVWPLILASASPRRRALLGRLGLPFEVAPSGADEAEPAGLAPARVAEALALVKARAVAAAHPGRVVIGADTIVALDGASLGKPRDAADAAAMLRRLRGRWHAVSTGLAVVAAGRACHDVVTAAVRMRDYGDDEIARYVAGGEPLDKAGAYAVQGRGGALVAEVRGSELAVVGLPLRRLAELLLACGVALPVDPATIVERWDTPTGPSPR
ncbi:MAG TPA: Maf family protein [Thermomicrobiales bacterium]|nr:Maf family protein [Thermomicrobiales bacterium]